MNKFTMNIREIIEWNRSRLEMQSASELRTRNEKILETKKLQLAATRETIRLVQNLLDETKQRAALLEQDIKDLSGVEERSENNEGESSLNKQ